MFVQSEVGDQLLELAILVFELAKAAKFSHPHTGKFLLPAVEGLFSDAESATEFQDWSAGFDLAKSVGYLFLGELGFLHRELLSRGPRF